MVKVTFDYEPDAPDESDPSGVTEDEYVRLMDALMQLGAQNIEVVGGA